MYNLPMNLISFGFGHRNQLTEKKTPSLNEINPLKKLNTSLEILEHCFKLIIVVF